VNVRISAAGLSAVYGDFISGEKFRWTSNNAKDLPSEEAEKLKKQLAKEAKELEKKIRRKHEKGAMAARFFWNLGEAVKSSDKHRLAYLIEKRIESYGLKICTDGQYTGWLMVPGYNAAGELVTVQYIDREGQKRFETGGKKKGAFFEIPGNNNKIIIAEGYATAAMIHQDTGYTAVVAFDAGNLRPVAEAIRAAHPETEIVIAADNDQWKPEKGNRGVEAATAAAIAIDAKVAIPQFPEEFNEMQLTDFQDLGRWRGPKEVRAQIEAAEPIDKLKALRAEIKKLADADPLEQEVERDRLSKKYSVRKSAIDSYLAELRMAADDGQAVVSEVEPAKDAVDGAKLLDGILAGLVRRVILPKGAAEAITLWVLLTYCHDSFNVLPLLGIVSPVKRCGKTTLIEILQGLTNKGLAASSLTPAAVFRTIEKYSPTLLIDEADTFLKQNDELRGILNSGHTRGSSFVIRVEGDDHEPVKFSTWAPKAIGMIGTLPDTLEDRSIVIQLRRKLSTEKIIKTGLDFADKAFAVRSRCRRWANDHLEELKAVQDAPLSSGNDRADDNWTPLFVIANLIGSGWPEKVRAAMVELVTTCTDDAIGSKLLTDIKEIFEAKAFDRIFSSDLVEALNNMAESPWADWHRGKGLSPNVLAMLLKPFGIESKTMRIGKNRKKGYMLNSFQDSFNRYIPRDSAVTPCQFNDFNNLGDSQNVTQGNDVTDEKIGNQLNLFDCHGVTDELEIIQENKGADSEKPKNWETGTI
jgi:putative DNA primase/helicase